jgi:hypothetical protein
MTESAFAPALFCAWAMSDQCEKLQDQIFYCRGFFLKQNFDSLTEERLGELIADLI